MANNLPYLDGQGVEVTLVTTDTGSDVHVPHLYAEGNIVQGLTDSGNPVKIGGRASSGVPSAVANLARVNAWFDLTGAQVVALRSGTDIVGYMGLQPRISGGYSVARLVSAATTNATNVKTSVGQVFGWTLWNDNAAHAFFKLYDKASAPTVGTDTPAFVVGIPPDSEVSVEFTTGIEFSTGIGYATTTGVADSDTGAVAANEVLVNLFYK